MCVHLGRGLTWSYPVLPRISQMCMTSKRHMYRCTTTWSARTRNCIPFSLTLSTHKHTYGILESDKYTWPMSMYPVLDIDLFRSSCRWWCLNSTADGTAPMGKWHAEIFEYVKLYMFCQKTVEKPLAVQQPWCSKYNLVKIIKKFLLSPSDLNLSSFLKPPSYTLFNVYLWASYVFPLLFLTSGVSLCFYNILVSHYVFCNLSTIETE